MGGTQLGSRWDTGEWAYSAEDMGQRLGGTFADSLLTFGLTNLPAAAHNISKNYSALAAAGEARLLAGEMPTADQLRAMGMSESEARGLLAVLGMDSADTPSSISKNAYTQQIKWGIFEIDVRPDGKGFWGKRTKQNDPRVDRYELKINPNNESYYLPHPNGGYVQFENMVNSTVQDGKLIIQQKSFYHINDLPDFAKTKVLQEATRQSIAANKAGYQVEWLVSDIAATKQLSTFFQSRHLDIIVTYFPE